MWTWLQDREQAERVLRDMLNIWTLKAILVSTHKEESQRENIHLLKEYINNHEQNVGKNNSKGHPGEGSDRNEKDVIGNWKKSDTYYKVAKNLTIKLY